MNTLTVSTPSKQKGLPPVASDLANIKQRQQATWSSGDFAVIGVTLQIVGESLAEATDILADERVLDVAAGNGNATLAAAGLGSGSSLASSGNGSPRLMISVI